MSKLSDEIKERQQEEQKSREEAKSIARRKERRRIGRTGRIGLAVTLGAMLVASPFVFSAVAGEGIDWDAFTPADVVEDETAEQDVSESSLDDDGMFASTESVQDKLRKDSAEKEVVATKKIATKKDVETTNWGMVINTEESKSPQKSRNISLLRSASSSTTDRAATGTETDLLRTKIKIDNKTEEEAEQQSEQALREEAPNEEQATQGKLVVEMFPRDDEESKLSDAIDNTTMSVSDTLMASTEDCGGIYLVDIPIDMPLNEAKAQILQSTDVANVYYDFIMQTDDSPAANDLNVSNKWEAAEDILNFSEAWRIARSVGWQDSSDVTIAVLDTGVIAHHQDLAGNIVATYDATQTSGIADLNGHGTAVAGIASACTDNGIGTASLAYNAKLLPIQVFKLFRNSNGSEVAQASLSDVLAGMEWLVTENPELGGETPAEHYNVRVANMSFGTPLTDSMSTEPPGAITRLWSKGVVVVNSAGNVTANVSLPYDHWPTTPARDCCIGVIAVDRDENNVLRRFPYSNYNTNANSLFAQISAPGANIFTTSSDGGYRSDFSGTSAAAPEVSSLLALMFSLDPSLTPAEAMWVICGNAREVPGSNNMQEVGYGMIDPAVTIQGVVDGLDLSGTLVPFDDGGEGEEDEYDAGSVFEDPSLEGASDNQQIEPNFTLFYDTDSIKVGETASVMVMGVPDGAGDISYTSSNSSVATVDQGTVTGVGVGTATITVSTAGSDKYLPTSKSVTIRVDAGDATIRVSPIPIVIGTGGKYSNIAYARPVAATSSLIYTSDNPSIATVDAQGTVTAIKPGQAKITISVPAGGSYNPTSAQVNVTVIRAPGTIGISSNNMSIQLGSAESIATEVPEGTSALTYTSSDASVATVNAEGVVTPKKVGSTTITIASADGEYYEGTSTTVNVTVDKADSAITASNKSVQMGKTVSLSAQATSAGTTGKLYYTVKDASIAKVDDKGTVTPLKVGTTKILIRTAETASSNMGSKEIALTVNKGTATITASNKSVTLGDQVSLGAKVNAGAAKLTYTSSNTKIAKVNASGTVTSVAAGKATITIKSAGNSQYGSASKSVTVTVNKQRQPMTVKASTKNAKYATVKKKAYTVTPLSVSNAQGKVTYAKASGSAVLTVNKNTGKVTVKKGTKKGTYKAKIKVSAAGNATYNAGNKTVEVTVKVVA